MSAQFPEHSAELDQVPFVAAGTCEHLQAGLADTRLLAARHVVIGGQHASSSTGGSAATASATAGSTTDTYSHTDANADCNCSTDSDADSNSNSKRITRSG